MLVPFTVNFYEMQESSLPRGIDLPFTTKQAVGIAIAGL